MHCCPSWLAQHMGRRAKLASCNWLGTCLKVTAVALKNKVRKASPRLLVVKLEIPERSMQEEMETVQFWSASAKQVTAGTERAAKLLSTVFVFQGHLCTFLPLQAGLILPPLGWVCNLQGGNSPLLPLRQRCAIIQQCVSHVWGWQSEFKATDTLMR